MRYTILTLICSLWFMVDGFGVITYSEEPVVPKETDKESTERLERITPVSKPWAEPGKPTMPPHIKQALSKKIPPIALWNIEVRSLLTTLAEIGELNITATNGVKGRLAVFLKRLEGVTIGDVLEIILVTQKLAMDIKGDIINIMTEAEFKALYGRDYTDNRQFKIIEVKNILPSTIAKKFLEHIKTTGGTIMWDDTAKHLIIIEYPDKLRQMETIIKRSDTPLITKTFEPLYARVANIESLLKKIGILSTIGEIEVGKVKIDTRTNQIFITDTPEKIKEMTDLITAIDAKPRQVLIEARMIQITLKDEFYMGVDWDKVFSAQSKWPGLNLVGKYPFPGDSIKTVPSDTFVATMPTGNFQGTIQLLQSYGTLKTISSPRLITLNNHPAKFLVGKQDFYVETTRTTSQGTVTETADVKFLDVGIALVISPTINADGFIMMHLEPSITEVYDRIRTSTGDPVPLIQKTTVSVDVLVKDGVTIVIAGLIKDEKLSSQTGIPILQSIPIIGPLFRQTGEVTQKTETIIFLTPYIVSGEADTSVQSKMEDILRKRPKDVREIK